MLRITRVELLADDFVGLPGVRLALTRTVGHRTAVVTQEESDSVSLPLFAYLATCGLHGESIKDNLPVER